MRRFAALSLLVVLSSAAPVSTTFSAEPPRPQIVLSDSSIARGKTVFAGVCRSCHGLRYLGEPALMPESAALLAFGKVPPDLSLMALARGRDRDGAAYIAALLAAYTDTPLKNTVYPKIAMPAPFSSADPDLKAKAADVAAYLLFAADPHDAERRRLGLRVLAYLGLLTALLFLLNRRTWSALGRRDAPRRDSAGS